MAIKLEKGASFNLTKEDPKLSNILIGLGWDLERNEIDVDVSVFMIGANGKVPHGDYFVFYNNLKSKDGSLVHSGDNRSGEGEGDDETIVANLSKVNSDIQEMHFVVTIHEAQQNGHHIGKLKNAYIRIVNLSTKTEMVRFPLDSMNNSNTSLVFGKLIKTNSEWSFNASGIGDNKTLRDYVTVYSK